MNKAFLILSIIIIGAAAYFSWENQERLKAEAGEVATIDTELSRSKSDLGRLSTEVETVETNLESVTTKRVEAETQLAQRKEDLQRHTNELTTKQLELRKINDDIAKIEAIVGQVDLESIGGLEQELETLAATQNELQMRLDELNVLIASERQRLTDAQVVRRNQLAEESQRAASLAARGAQAVISAVDPTWGFVVINMRSTAGISPNDRAVVFRSGERVGLLQITEIERGQIIANVVNEPGIGAANVVPGDTVIFQQVSE